MQTYHKSQWAAGDPPADRTAVLTEESGQTKNNDALLERSAALVHTEHYAEAKKILNSILAQEPQNGQARYLNGNVCVALNDIAQAKENYEIAIKAGYVTSKVIMSLALVEKVLGQEYKAEKHLRGLLEKEPDALVPKVLLYSLYAEQSRFEDAAKVAEGMADAFPESYGGCHAQLQADWGQKKYTEALSLLEEQKDRFGAATAYIQDYTSTLLLLEKYKEADAYWQQNKEKLPKDSLELLLLEARVASGLRDRARTIAANQKLLDLYQLDNAAAVIASLFIEEQKYDMADRYLSRILEQKKHDMVFYSALFLHAFCLEQSDGPDGLAAYQAAIRAYEETYQNNVINTYVMRFAAECYRRLGDKENASRCDGIVADFQEKLQSALA